MSDEVKCRVCGAPSNGMHFGIEACRACAAFFRRTVSCGRGYICQSKNNCEISLSVRNICRSCRYRKCLKCGMLIANVQPKRDSLKNSYETTKYQPTSLQESKHFEEQFRSQDETVSTNSVNPKLDYFMLNPSQNLVVRPLSSHSILNLVRQEYYHLCETRMAVEKRFMDENSHLTVKTNTVETSELEFISLKHLMELNNMFMPLIAKFTLNAFEQFRVLPRDQKWVLFSAFVPFLFSLELYFYTLRCFPLNTKFNLLRLTSHYYLDVNRIDEFCGLSEPYTTLGKLLKEFFTRHARRISDIRKLNISESEFVALIGLSLFSEGIPDTTAETSHICQTMRNKLFHGLHIYYTEELGMKEYALRLGNTMSLLALVWRELLMMKSTVEIAEVFGVVNINDILFEKFSSDSF